jgi:hypothetical protein
VTRPMLVTYLRGAPNKSNEYVSDSTDKERYVSDSTDKERYVSDSTDKERYERSTIRRGTHYW